MRFLLVGVPGLCFVILGALDAEYPAGGLGGILVIGSVYEFSRKRVAVRMSDQAEQRRSVVLAGIIGVSFAIAGFVSHGYLLGAAGIVLLTGALLRLYRPTPE